MTRSFYWRRQRLQGRSEDWIEEDSQRFFKLFEKVRREGFRRIGAPILMVEMNGKLVRQNGAHRAAIAWVLGTKELECLILEA